MVRVRASVGVMSDVAITINFEMSLDICSHALDVNIQFGRPAVAWTTIVHACLEAWFSVGLRNEREDRQKTGLTTDRIISDQLII